MYGITVSQLKETLFDKLDFFNIPYMDEQQLFQNVALFDFKSISVREDVFKDTESAKWIGQHDPIYVSISSNLLQNSSSICNCNPRDLASSFLDALESLAAQSKAQMRMSLHEVETAMKSKLSHLIELLNERRLRPEATFTLEVECGEAESEGKESVSTKFLHMQKKELIELQDLFVRNNVLPVFGFNSGEFDITLIKTSFLPMLVNLL